MKRTKIVCTIGPASESREVIEQLVAAGMNVARLNFSHGTHESHGEIMRLIREASAKLRAPVAILQDIAGPKIRIGAIENGPVNLEPGAPFTLTSRDVKGNSREATVNFRDLPSLVHAGDTLLLADGMIELEVLYASDENIECRVVVGGALNSRKGVNLPTRSTGIPILTEKDLADLRFGLEQGVDYIALSFVRNLQDIQRVRAVMEEASKSVPLIAKIEKPEALENIDAIIHAVDCIMVARGDLGVELPFEQVPRAQKMIIAKANAAGIPVITATQMLESMVTNPRPTRAEVNDVANAILDGADAVMLSEESAMGQYPVKAVEAMSRIALDTERHFPHEAWMERFEAGEPNDVETSVSRAACDLAETLDVAALVATTTSGLTARQVARYRPARPILAPTPLETTFRRLALVWGVEPMILPPVEHTEQVIRNAFELIRQEKRLPGSSRVVVTAGIPANLPGRTNFVAVMNING